MVRLKRLLWRYVAIKEALDQYGLDQRGFGGRTGTTCRHRVQIAIGVVPVRGRTGTDLGKPAPRTPVLVRYLSWDQYGVGRRTGTICAPAWVETKDQYDMGTGTATGAVPVRGRTGTGLEQNGLGPRTGTTPDQYSI
jgi:hypothetical protein